MAKSNEDDPVEAFKRADEWAGASLGEGANPITRREAAEWFRRFARENARLFDPFPAPEKRETWPNLYGEDDDEVPRDQDRG